MSQETRKTLLGLLLGFLLPALVFAMIYSPEDELPSVATPPVVPRSLMDVSGTPAPGENRIIVLGASLTAGYPYAPGLAGCYARYLGVGLRSLYPDRKIQSEAWAKPALDSARLVEMCERALQCEPTLLVVTLGSNEFANRIFSGQVLVPGNPFELLAEKLSRSRIFYDSLARTMREGTSEDRNEVQQELEKQILAKIIGSGPGKPGLTSLPISTADQDLLIRRLERSMIRIDELCRESGTPLVFCVANYALGGFWPWGTSEGGRDELVEEYVSLYRRSETSGLLTRVAAALESRPRRADLRFLHGRLLEESGRHADARREYEAARDMDGVPMHLTGAIRSTLLETAKNLSRDCLVLDDPLEALGKEGIPPRSFYLDYGHLDESGHEEIALWLAERLAEGGYLRDLGPRTDPWRIGFRAAIESYQETNVHEVSRRQAQARMATANGTFSMLFGNYRDALPYLVTAFEGCLPALKAEISISLATCVLRLAGRENEVASMSHDERTRLFVRHFESFKKAQLEGNLWELVERLRQGAKLVTPEKD